MLHVETFHAQIVEDRLGSDTNAVLNEIGKIQQAMTFGPETGKLCQFCWKLSCFFWYSRTWNCSHLSPWANTVCSWFHTFLIWRNLDFVRTDGGDDSWGLGQSAAVASSAFDLMKGRNAASDKNAPKRVRVREFFAQTDAVEQQEKMVQTDPKMQVSEKKREKPPPRGSIKKKLEVKSKAETKLPSSRTRGFNDPDQLKQKARQALIKPPYNVFDYYHDEGVFQRIAKSLIFDYLSLTVVCLNAMWIAVDADLNGAAVITDSPPIFILVENLFCTYFVSEVFIRFMAFEEKFRCLRDRWFVFDSLLVALRN